MAQQKIYFLSDAHLGSKSHADSIETERKLCRWLDMAKSDAKAIYLLGDMFDYWFEYKYVVPKGFTRVLGKLAEVSDSGVEVHFFIGNHDIWLGDYLTRECGMILHFEPFVTTLGTRKFYLAHGDGLGDDSLSFRFLRALFHNKFLIKCFAAVHPTLTVPLAYKWSNSSRENGGVQEYLGEDKEHLVLFAKQKIVEMPDIDYFVFGHRHILLDLPIGQRTRVIILGDWIRYFSYAVFDGEKVELLQFEE
ncbi:MAG: UDP-2,3-diacylglucosamine diphosphatase [Dysgonomonadaceae bacterium]|nr:UDP-2,3-diacylglucosamine diphosphatase [Dysgonamonadaceae bacterium]